jgi:hypothetical protein
MTVFYKILHVEGKYFNSAFNPPHLGEAERLK